MDGGFLYPTCTRGKAIGKFLISYDGIVDLLTIIPVFFLSGFVAFRMLRVVRIFHLFRINSRYDSFNVIKMVLVRKSRQIISSMFIIFILMMASSLCMYSTEHAAQRGCLAMLSVEYGGRCPRFLPWDMGTFTRSRCWANVWQ